MFDFLTLSVVIDDKIFCVHGGQFALIHRLNHIYRLSYMPLFLLSKGLSPSIHSIDQIKVVDRFRGLHPHIIPGRVIRLPAPRIRNTTRRAHGRPCLVGPRS